MYSVKTTKIDNGPKYWSYLLCEVFQEDKKIGEYTRNYGTLYNTFHPFTQNGKDYALYSEHYTATCVMSLPDCKKIAGEEPCAHGFCPTDFYVPCDPPDEDNWISFDGSLQGKFGFVSGCVWGDDSSWKVQYLDLSQIEQGIFKREEKFGYLELLPTLKLKDAINIEWWEDSIQKVDIAGTYTFFLKDHPHWNYLQHILCTLPDKELQQLSKIIAGYKEGKVVSKWFDKLIENKLPSGVCS